jgi:ATP-dependent DNA helicase RecG
MPSGGTIVLGVNERDDFAVIGVSDTAVLEAGIASQARNGVVPPVQTDFDVVKLDRHEVLVVTVAGLPAVDKPCRYRGKAYLRQADGDYVMSEQEIAQLVALQDRPRYDAVSVANSSVEDLDKDLADRFLDEARASSRRLASRVDLDVLRMKGVISVEGLTLAGLYAMGSYPQQFTPSLAITAAVIPDRGDRRLADLVHLDGPIPDLLEQTVEWVRRNTSSAVVFGADGHGNDLPEIPLVAVREFVANALVHRDLSPRTQSKRVEVRLLPDRLVITSPGGLWGVSHDKLGEPGGKSAVNEFLYDICHFVHTSSRHRIIEGEGGGIREARDALREAGLADPVFVDTGVAFTVIVFRPEATPKISSVQAATADGPPPVARSSNSQTLLTRLARGPAGITAMVTESGLTRRQVKYALDRLVNAGQVVVEGGQGNRFTVYRRS